MCKKTQVYSRYAMHCLLCALKIIVARYMLTAYFRYVQLVKKKWGVVAQEFAALGC